MKAKLIGNRWAELPSGLLLDYSCVRVIPAHDPYATQADQVTVHCNWGELVISQGDNEALRELFQPKNDGSGAREYASTSW